MDWDLYLAAPWRSERARELDKLGGLTRPPLRRGDSMTAKLQFLGSALAEQGQLIKAELYKSLPVAGPASPKKPPPPIRNKSQKQQVPPPASGAAQHWVEVPGVCPITGAPTTIQVAAWRIKLHAARRRAFLKLLTIMRCWKGIHTPTRCRRVANWGWAVQRQLDDRLPRFLEDQLLSESLRASIEANRALLEQLCRDLSSADGFSGPEGAVSLTASDLQSAVDILSGKSILPGVRSTLEGAGGRTGAEGAPRYRCSAPGFLQIPGVTSGSIVSPHSPSRDMASGGLIAGSPLALRSRHILMRQLTTSDTSVSNPIDPPNTPGNTSLPAMLAGILGTQREFIRSSSVSGSIAPPPSDSAAIPRRDLLQPLQPRNPLASTGGQLLPPLRTRLATGMRASDSGAPSHHANEDRRHGARGRSSSMSGGPVSGLPAPMTFLTPLPETGAASSTSAVSSGTASPAARSPRVSLAGAKRTPLPKKVNVGFGTGFAVPSPPRQPKAPSPPQQAPPVQAATPEVASPSHMSHVKLLKHMSPLSRGPSTSGACLVPPDDPPGAGQAAPAAQQSPGAATPSEGPVITQPAVPPVIAGPVAATILRRTVAAAGVLDAASAGQGQEGISRQEGAASQDPQTDWRLQLAKLRRGEAVQPLAVLMKPPPAEAPEPPPFNPWASRDQDAADEQLSAFQQAGDSETDDKEVEGPQVEQEQQMDVDKDESAAADCLTGEQPEGSAGNAEPVEQASQPVQGEADEPGQARQMSNWKLHLMRELQELDRGLVSAGSASADETGQDDTLQQACQGVAQIASSAHQALTQALGAGGGGMTQEQVDRIMELTQKLKADVEALRAAESRMTMHVMRVNSTWARDQVLGPPELQTPQQVDNWLGSTSGDKYKAEFQKMLKAGQVAFLFNAFQDEVQLLDGQRQNLWCSDPWDMLSQFMPDEEQHGDSTWGGRVLLQLLHTVQSVAGPASAAEAVANAYIIIAIDDTMQEVVLKNMWLQRFYGFNRQRVIFMMQPRRQAHIWCASSKEFIEDPLAEASPVGSGVTLMQMAWVCEAFTLNPDGEPVPLSGTVLELLEQQHVTRACDMSLITKGSSLSLPLLTYTQYLRDQALLGMLSEVHFTDQPPQGLKETVVLGCKSVYQAWHQSIKAETELQLNLSGVQSAVELTDMETQSSELVGILGRIRSNLNGKLPLSCGRYTFHVPTLKSLMTTPNHFRPKLRLASGGSCSVHIHTSDVSGVPGMRCLAARTRPEDWQGLFQGHADLKTLAALLHAQDGNPELRKLAFNARGWGGSPRKTAASPRSGVLASPVASPACTSVNTIVVFVINNRVSQTAVDIACSVAKAGRDFVRLVTFVSSEGAVDEAHEVLLRMYRTCINQQSITTDVVVRGDGGLLDAMEGYLAQCNAYMAVMGSVHMMLAAGGNLVIGSVVLTLLRRAAIPILVVTASSAKLAEGSRPRLRIGLVVDRTARPLHTFLCQRMADPSRGDALILMESEQSRTQAQAQAQKRMFDSLTLASEGESVKILRSLVLTGPVDEALLEAVDTNGINILGLQMTSQNVPPWIQGLIRACKGAVLIHPHRPVPSGGSPRP